MIWLEQTLKVEPKPIISTFVNIYPNKNLKKIYIFLTKNYHNELNISNPNIIFILKSNFFENTLLRILWMQLILPFELKKLKVEKFFAPMNICPLFLKFSKIKITLGLHSNLPWLNFNNMPGNPIKKILTKYFMERSIKISDKIIVCSLYAKKKLKNC